MGILKKILPQASLVDFHQLGHFPQASPSLAFFVLCFFFLSLLHPFQLSAFALSFFHGSSEAVRFRSGFNDVSAIGDAIQHRFA